MTTVAKKYYIILFSSMLAILICNLVHIDSQRACRNLIPEAALEPPTKNAQRTQISIEFHWCGDTKN